MNLTKDFLKATKISTWIDLIPSNSRWRSQEFTYQDFPGGPVVKTLPSNAGGASSIPGQGDKIPHALWPKNENIKQKQYCKKFNKDFKNSLYKKNL